MAWDFNNPQHFARATMILVAMEAGELTEGQTAALLGVDRWMVRDMRQSCLNAAKEAWENHRRSQERGMTT